MCGRRIIQDGIVYDDIRSKREYGGAIVHHWCIVEFSVHTAEHAQLQWEIRRRRD